MRTALYLRVSSHEQVQHGHSIKAQEERLRAYATAKDLDNIKVYKDEGASGASINRPGIQALIRDVKENRVSTILIYKLDRLSRSQKDTLHLIEDVFNQHDTALISISESFDTSTPFGRAMIGILSVFAQLERENIRERMMIGKEQNAKLGRWNGGGNQQGRVFGYRRKDKQWQVDEYEAKIIRDVFDTYNKGNGITRTRNAINEKYGEVFPDHTRVSTLLKNPFYLGKVKYGDKFYEGEHEAIVDEEVFNQAQVLREKRSKRTMTGKHDHFILRGLIECAHCGKRYSSRGKSKSRPERYDYYVCYTRFTNSRYPERKKCFNKNYRAEDLHKAVMDEVYSFTSPSFKFKTEPENDTLSIYTEKLLEVTKQIERVTDLYISGNVPAGILNDRMGKLNKEKEALEKSIEDHTPKSAVAIRELEKLQDIDLDSLTDLEMNNLLHVLIDKIVIDEEDVQIYYNFTT